MGSIPWFVVLSAFSFTVEGIKPSVKIYPEAEELEVKNGENINLRCESTEPVKWKIPTDLLLADDMGNPYVTINSTQNSSSEYAYISYLQVREAIHADTGYFHCHHSDVTSMSATDGVAKVYIFVYDENNLVHTQTTSIQVIEGHTALIDCRPSSLSVNMTLWKDNKLVFPSHDANVKYNPRIGFEITHAYMNNSGWYKCSGNLGNHTNATIIPLQVLSPSTLRPMIHINGTRVISGKDLKMECIVPFQNDALFTMTWITPNPAANQSGRLIISAPSKQHSKGLASLKIRNVTFDDEGEYACLVEDTIFTNNKNISKINITVEGIQKPSFDGIYENVTKYRASLYEYVNISCTVTGVPEPIITWLKDGEEFSISNDNGGTVLRNGNQTLSFYSVRGKDAGIYNCKASNYVGETERFFELVINDERGIGIGVYLGLGVMITITVVAIQFYLWKERKRKELLRQGEKLCDITKFVNGDLESIDPDLGVEEQAELLPYDMKWEFPRDKLNLGKQLGSGAFGKVIKAEAYGIVEDQASTTVAVKMLKENAQFEQIKALVSELKIMVHLGKHLNVVNLLGACTKNLDRRELYVIVEYCCFGNLQDYLLKHRGDFIDQIDPKTGKVKACTEMEHYKSGLVNGDAWRLSPENMRFNKSPTPFSNGGAVQGKNIAAQNYKELPKIQELKCGRFSFNDSTSVCTPDSVCKNGSCANCSGRSFNCQGDYKKEDVHPITTTDLICWAFQTARGVDYLASRKILHGDLAARNILLAEDNIVKICDFGLAKTLQKSDIYKKSGHCQLPFKWMAIESIRDRIFSTQSDVWSFGIVLWEFFSLAQVPYPGMRAEELYDIIFDGYRMKKPKYATDQIYSMMRDCWNEDPMARPTFHMLSVKLGEMLDEAIRNRFISLNSHYEYLNDLEMRGVDHLKMMSEPIYTNVTRTETRVETEKVNNHENSPSLEYVPMSNIDCQSEGGAENACNRRMSQNASLGDHWSSSSPTPSNGNCNGQSNYMQMNPGSISCHSPLSVFGRESWSPPQIFTFDVPSTRAARGYSLGVKYDKNNGTQLHAVDDNKDESEDSPQSEFRPRGYSMDSGFESPKCFNSTNSAKMIKSRDNLSPRIEEAES